MAYWFPFYYIWSKTAFPLICGFRSKNLVYTHIFSTQFSVVWENEQWGWGQRWITNGVSNLHKLFEINSPFWSFYEIPVPGHMWVVTHSHERKLQELRWLLPISGLVLEPFQLFTSPSPSVSNSPQWKVRGKKRGRDFKTETISLL